MLVKANPEVTLTLPSNREIAITSLLDHPPALVYEAWTNPEHVRHWWGCEGSEISVCEMDVRPGGAWRVVMRMADGSEHPFKGVYREVVKNERLVYTQCYEMPAFGSPEWLTTIMFEDAAGKTKFTHHILHASAQARDGHLQAGMEAGSIQTVHRLAERVGLMMEAHVRN